MPKFLNFLTHENDLESLNGTLKECMEVYICFLLSFTVFLLAYECLPLTSLQWMLFYGNLLLFLVYESQY